MAEYFTKDGDNYVKFEDKLFTQADVDTDILPKRLERERGKFADYDDLKAKAAKVDTVTQEFTEKINALGTEKETLSSELASAKLETEKVKVIHEFKLSDDLAEFVDGKTVEDLRTKAEKLAKGVTGGTVIVDKKPKPEDKNSDTKKAAQSLFGTKPD